MLTISYFMPENIRLFTINILIEKNQPVSIHGMNAIETTDVRLWTHRNYWKDDSGKKVMHIGIKILVEAGLSKLFRGRASPKNGSTGKIPPKILRENFP